MHVTDLSGRPGNYRLLSRPDHDWWGRIFCSLDNPVQRRFSRHRNHGLKQSGIDFVTSLKASVQVVQHVSGECNAVCCSFKAYPITPRGDENSQPIFQCNEILIILAKQLWKQLWSIERYLSPTSVTGASRLGFSAHRIPLLSGASDSRLSDADHRQHLHIPQHASVAAI
jgi:hypothetical protein